MARKSILETTLALLLMARLVVASTLSFQPLTAYPDGTNDFVVTVADFNGDGNRDLAVLNFRDNTISILLGNGDGTFQSATMIAGDTNSFSIANADFNGDHRADLVITGDSGLTVLLGNGDGSFQAPHSYAAGTSVNSVHVADFNGDGKTDLAVANANGVGILLGNGDGTFQADVDYSLAGPGSTTLVVGDFNGDGKIDVVAGGLEVLLGNGDGTFQPATVQSGLLFVRDVADLDHDGKLDLLVDGGTGPLCGSYPHWYFCGAPVGVMFGNGDGTFRAPVILDRTAITYSGFVSDLDGDGNPDVAVVDGSNVSIFLGDGKGSFAAAQKFALRASGTNGLVGSAAAIDLNGDEAPDIIGLDRQGSIGILLNSTGSDFSISASAFNPSAINPGQSATSTVTLKLLNAFHFPVGLTCSVQSPGPGGPTCSFNSNSVTFDTNGNASAALTINEGPSAALLGRPKFFNGFAGLALSLPVMGFAFLGTGFDASLSSRRRFLILLIATVLLAGLVAQTGCGGGSSGDPKSTAYTVTVTATSGTAQHSTAVNLTVQ
jgi:hypothetical protein